MGAGRGFGRGKRIARVCKGESGPGSGVCGVCGFWDFLTARKLVFERPRLVCSFSLGWRRTTAQKRFIFDKIFAKISLSLQAPVFVTTVLMLAQRLEVLVRRHAVEPGGKPPPPEHQAKPAARTATAAARKTCCHRVFVAGGREAGRHLGAAAALARRCARHLRRPKPRSRR